MTEKNQTKQSIYERLSKINVKPYLSKIDGYAKKSHKHFTLWYLSWPIAWGLVKAIYPDASYRIKEYPNWVRDKDGNFQQAGTLDYRITSVGCEVEVTVTIEDQKYTQKLYPMDRSNNPILRPNIKEINKAQLRCLVKALATAGLGLSVYAGEDLPANENETAHKPEPVKRAKSKPSYHHYTDKELDGYKVMYRTDKQRATDAKETLIGVIYVKAMEGDKDAAKWWKENRVKVHSPEGQALLQYEQYARRLKARSVAKRAKEKETA